MEAIDNGAQKIILGLGGSATVDGGLGILQAFGIELYDAEGKIISNSTNPLLKLENISAEHIDPRLQHIEFQILCDVDNPLLGEHGAVNVFGPQKGADALALKTLESSMERFNKILNQKTAKSFFRL